MHRLFIPVVALILAGGVHAQTPPVIPPPTPRPISDPQPLDPQPTPADIQRANLQMPNTQFLGKWTNAQKQFVQRQWRAMPLIIRLQKPPGFRIVSAAEMKNVKGIVVEATGAYDINNGVIYIRPDTIQGVTGHEGYHRIYYLGYYPARIEPMLMNWKQKMAWRAWVQGVTQEPPSPRFPLGRTIQHYKLIPQYTYLIQNGKIMDRELDHEKWAQAGAVYSFPGGKHPWYGTCHPTVAAQMVTYVGTANTLPAWALP